MTVTAVTTLDAVAGRLGWKGYRSERDLSKVNVRLVVWFIIIHILGLLGLVGAIIFGVHWASVALKVGHFFLGQLSTTIDVHRATSHPTIVVVKGWLRKTMLVFQAMNAQAQEWVWGTWHRIHHKVTDSRVFDFHSSEIGPWHSHMRWAYLEAAYQGIRYTARVQMKDRGPSRDPLLHWQRRHFLKFVVVGILVPSTLPLLWVDWTWWGIAQGPLFCAFSRLMFQYHFTWVINSLYHSGRWRVPWGIPIQGSGSAVNPYWIPRRIEGKPWTYHPFTRYLIGLPMGLMTQVLTFLTVGEGWHANHHIAPDDWRLGRGKWDIDPGKWVIALFIRAGWVEVLQTVSDEEFAARQPVLARKWERRWAQEAIAA